MSDELKRVFFGARRTVIWNRGQIESEIIKIKKYWKRSGILDIFFWRNSIDIGYTVCMLVEPVLRYMAKQGM
jgi:hypothetical protein